MSLQNSAGSPVTQEWSTLLIELGLDADHGFTAVSCAAEIELIIEDLDRPLALAGPLLRVCVCDHDGGAMPRME